MAETEHKYNVDYKLTNGDTKSAGIITVKDGENASINLNGEDVTNASFYAPITSGESGQILQSNGQNKAPTWIASSGKYIHNITIMSNRTILYVTFINDNPNSMTFEEVCDYAYHNSKSISLTGVSIFVSSGSILQWCMYTGYTTEYANSTALGLIVKIYYISTGGTALSNTTISSYETCNDVVNEL